MAFGAVPGIIMIYFRVRMEETSRFAATKQPPALALSTTSKETDTQITATSDFDTSSAQDTVMEDLGTWDKFIISAKLAWNSEKVQLVLQNWKRLVGTAGSWFLLDITFYANGLFSSTIIK